MIQLKTLGEVIDKVRAGQYTFKYGESRYGRVKGFLFRGQQVDVDADDVIGIGSLNGSYVITENNGVITVNPEGTKYYFHFTPVTA